MSIKVSDSDSPKFENVIGSNNKADAKIAGITPAVFIFNGKWEGLRHKFYFPFVFWDN